MLPLLLRADFDLRCGKRSACSALSARGAAVTTAVWNLRSASARPAAITASCFVAWSESSLYWNRALPRGLPSKSGCAIGGGNEPSHPSNGASGTASFRLTPPVVLWTCFTITSAFFASIRAFRVCRRSAAASHEWLAHDVQRSFGVIPATDAAPLLAASSWPAARGGRGGGAGVAVGRVGGVGGVVRAQHRVKDTGGRRMSRLGPFPLRLAAPPSSPQHARVGPTSGAALASEAFQSNCTWPSSSLAVAVVDEPRLPPSIPVARGTGLAVVAGTARAWARTAPAAPVGVGAGVLADAAADP